MSSTGQQIGEHWNARTRKRRPKRWQANPHIVRGVNRCAFGVDSLTWGAGLVQKLKVLHSDRIPFKQAVSVACGNGRKEMDLIVAGLVESFVLFELAEKRAEDGREIAARLGIADRVEFRVEDVFATGSNPLPDGAVDLVVWFNALHHMFDTPRAVEWSHRVLKPGGAFLMDDYVGPDRFQFSDEVVSMAHMVRSTLPDEVFEHDGDYTPRGRKRPLATPEAVISVDPSEAADSARILPAVSRWFPEWRQYDTSSGLLIFGLADIASRLLDDRFEPFVNLTIGLDRWLIEQGHLAYSAVIAQK